MGLIEGQKKNKKYLKYYFTKEVKFDLILYRIEYRRKKKCPIKTAILIGQAQRVNRVPYEPEIKDNPLSETNYNIYHSGSQINTKCLFDFMAVTLSGNRLFSTGKSFRQSCTWM